MEYGIAYAAVQGTAHIFDKIPCQDKVFGWSGITGAVIVLADGAGSCPNSHHGAQTAGRAALEVLKKWCGQGWPNEYVAKHELIEACLKKMSDNPYPLREQSCTLLFCAVNAEGQYYCGHLGDGYVFRSGEEGTVLLSDAQWGGSVNETVFLTTENAEEYLRLKSGILEEGEAIMLCSDGAGESLYNRRLQTCAPAVSRIAQWIREYSGNDVAKALEHNLDTVLRLNSSDDMSIAVLARRHEGVFSETGEELTDVGEPTY